MRRLMSRVILFLIACVLWGPNFATAQFQQRTTFKLGASSFLRSFREVVKSPHRATVQIERYDERERVWVDTCLGAVVDPQGLVVTKSSELQGTLRANLALHDRIDVTVLARDRKHDLAIVQIGLPGAFVDQPLETITWADETTAVGRWVVTPDIGRLPAAVGVVSVGPRVIPQSEEAGWLGIIMSDQTQQPVVESCYPGGSADLAGIRPEDTIVAIDGQAVRQKSSLQRLVNSRHPGDNIRVAVRREEDAEPLILNATLQHLPPRTNDRQSQWNVPGLRSRWNEMNELGSRLSIRRDNFPSAIQHDTVLKPEECGGVALNLDGEAIGINIARSGRTESLLLPADVAKAAIDRMLTTISAQQVSTK